MLRDIDIKGQVYKPLTRPEKDGSRVLVGIAVDVSGSMKQSIRNESGGDLDRLGGFLRSLKRLSDEAKRAIEGARKGDATASIDLFVYAFGLNAKTSGVEHCDLLSLLKLGQGLVSAHEEESDSTLTGDDPYQELAAIAGRHGISVTDKYFDWVKGTFSSSEAASLLGKLRRFPHLAEQLASMLPRSWAEVHKRVEKKTLKGAVAGVVLGIDSSFPKKLHYK